MFMAEVLSIDADEKYIDEKGAFDISKCDLIAYSNGNYYSIGRKIGKFGYSVMKKSTLKNKKSKSNDNINSKKTKAKNYKRKNKNK